MNSKLKDNPVISIIIPVYKVEGYIQCCLDSVLAQSYTDWECICIDDGSPDNSGRILDEYADRDPRFKIVHQNNAGVSSARNVGLSLASGEWICFIDSDDWVSPFYLNHMLESAMDDVVDYVVSGCESVQNGNVVRSTIPFHSCVFSIDIFGEESFADLLQKHLLNGPYAKLFRREIIKNKHIQFPVDVEYGEDLIFNNEYLKNVRRAASVAVSDYFYRQISGTSLSHKPRPNRFCNDYSQWRTRLDFLCSRNLFTQRIREFMYRELWGIVYDGLFETSANRDYSYIKRILSIPEIKELNEFSKDFEAAGWIKTLILHRQSILFWLLTKVK